MVKQTSPEVYPLEDYSKEEYEIRGESREDGRIREISSRLESEAQINPKEALIHLVESVLEKARSLFAKLD